MVKSGTIIEEWQRVRRGKPRKTISARVKVSVPNPVYFPEQINGEIDLMKWELTEKEAMLKERWYKVLKETEAELEAFYKRRRCAWNQICEELGLEHRQRRLG